jgi:hypothetical protein
MTMSIAPVAGLGASENTGNPDKQYDKNPTKINVKRVFFYTIIVDVHNYWIQSGGICISLTFFIHVCYQLPIQFFLDLETRRVRSAIDFTLPPIYSLDLIWTFEP